MGVSSQVFVEIIPKQTFFSKHILKTYCYWFRTFCYCLLTTRYFGTGYSEIISRVEDIFASFSEKINKTYSI